MYLILEYKFVNRTTKLVGVAFTKISILSQFQIIELITILK